MSTIPSGNLDSIGRVLQRVQLERRYESNRQLERIAVDPQGDRVTLGRSGDAARLQSLLLEDAAALPDVREERVAEVKALVAAGYYDQEDVVEKIGERFLASPEGQQALDGAARETLPGDAERADLMRDVQNKLKAGFYTDGEVMNFVADRLLDLYKVDGEPEGGATTGKA